MVYVIPVVFADLTTGYQPVELFDTNFQYIIDALNTFEPTGTSTNFYRTVAEFQAADIPAEIDDGPSELIIAEYLEDFGGQITLVRGTNVPGALQSADGQYWIIVPTEYSFQMRGAAGDGVIDDTLAVQNSELLNGATLALPGVYKTTINQAALNGSFYGKGQVRDSDGNKRGPYFNAIRTRPAIGDYASILTAWNGDVSKVAVGIEHRVYNAATLGQPSTGYLYTPECYPEYTTVFNSSGHNESTSTNIGRTMMATKYDYIAHSGQGDMYAHIISGTITSTKPGATGFLANPAIGCFGGGLFAGVNGIMCNISEIHIDGTDKDISGIGPHTVLIRNVEIGALSCVWLGDLVSSTGTAWVDAAYIAKGKFKVGLDLSGIDFGTHDAAIALPADSKIYFASSQPAVGNTAANWYATDPGVISVGWVDAISALVVQIGPDPLFQISPIQILAYNVPFNAFGTSSYQVNSIQVMGDRITGWTPISGTVSRGAYTTYTAGAASVGYVQSELQAVMNALQALSRRYGALDTDSTTQGFIGV